MLCDLSSQQSIRAFVAEFLRTHDALHVLVNNAKWPGAKNERPRHLAGPPFHVKQAV